MPIQYVVLVVCTSTVVPVYRAQQSIAGTITYSSAVALQSTQQQQHLQCPRQSGIEPEELSLPAPDTEQISTSILGTLDDPPLVGIL